MHPALEIPEILLNIFYHSYDQPGRDDVSDRAMASLARTCRTFQEPALEVLWHTLPGPSRLAQCLPEASRTQSTGEVKWQ